MKCACLFAAAALAGAVAPPTISLNLEGMTSAYKLDTSIVREHDLGLTQNNGAAVSSRQDWTEKCAANLNGVTAATCPFPVANAYDHHDGVSVSVHCRLFLVDEANVAMATPQEKANCARESVDFTKRSTYLFKYDATDKAGNHAEQVVFALILNDITAPVFNEAQCDDAITVEAGTNWSLCKQSASDNLDGDLTESVTYRIQEVQADTFTNIREMMPVNKWGDYAAAKQVFTPHAQSGVHNCDQALNCGPVELGKFLVTAKVSDSAGIYGHNSANNEATTHVAIVVDDTQAPLIQIIGYSPVFHECISAANFQGDKADVTKDGFNYVDAGADCLDQYDTWALKHTQKVYGAGCTDCPEVAAGSLAARVYDPSGITSARGTNEVGKTLTQTTFFNILADDEQTKDRTITFKAKDIKGNTAVQATRTVTTRDTISPALTLHAPVIVDRYEGSFSQANGMYTHSAHSSHGTDDASIIADIDPANSVTAHDWCDDSRSPITRSFDREFNSRVLGHYVRTYATEDIRKNKASTVRTFNVIDEEVPTISVVYSDAQNAMSPQTFEATRDVEYTDEGATCNDYVDGELSHAVEVSGNVVSMTIPGTYVVEYDCSDLSGNPADTKKRTIVVQDTTCPEIELTAASLIYIEAGFPYVDTGASATDTLDGDITQYIWTDGNTVNHKQAFYGRRSCAEIQSACTASADTTNENDHSTTQVCKSGEYYITTVRTINGEKRFHRELVHCWMEPTPAVTFKVFQVGDCIKVHEELGMPSSMNCHKQDGCPLIGMTHNNAVGDALSNYINLVKGTNVDFAGIRGTNDLFAKSYATTAGSKVSAYGDTTYICKEQDRVDTAGMTWTGDNQNTDSSGNAVTNAEQGKYIIQFHVSDKAGNHECSAPYRTVIVKDTLPPVITLELNNKLIHISKGDQQGINGQTNPAGPSAGTVNPNLVNKVGANGAILMAETVTSNGWIMGAVASAVAGVALLSYGSRSTTVSVPV